MDLPLIRLLSTHRYKCTVDGSLTRGVPEWCPISTKRVQFESTPRSSTKVVIWEEEEEKGIFIRENVFNFKNSGSPQIFSCRNFVGLLVKLVQTTNFPHNHIEEKSSKINHSSFSISNSEILYSDRNYFNSSKLPHMVYIELQKILYYCWKWNSIFILTSKPKKYCWNPSIQTSLRVVSRHLLWRLPDSQSSCSLGT